MSDLEIQYRLLPYLDASALLNAIDSGNWAVLLDSGQPGKLAGRYSIASADPCDRLEVNEGDTASALDALKPKHHLQRPAEIQHLPFTSGWMGYLSYDAARLFEKLPNLAQADISLPWVRMGYYPWALVSDHLTQQTWLCGHDISAELEQRLLARAQTPRAKTPFAITHPFQSNLSAAQYQAYFEQIQAWLKAGDCYQVNLAQRLSAEYEGDLCQAWQHLRQQIHAPFSAFLSYPDAHVLSLSPERFLHCTEDGQVETRPIKGTRPRGQTAAEDEQLRESLATSLKDQAENLMIVDLLRNDLGRVCQPGSIQVPSLFEVESHSNVHHLVSQVSGQLAAQKTATDLLAATFPGGSITGAPKCRAMEIIDQLEPCRRSVYCGSIGYLDDSGRMDLNIAIRTFVAQAGQIHLWGGGGIVADSQAEAEYRETYHKMGRLIQALQSDFTPPF